MRFSKNAIARSLSRLPALLLLGSAAACVGQADPAPGEEIAPASEPIIGGSTVAIDTFGTPVVYTPIGGCSGTMLTDTWLLTAHHCVTNGELTTGGTAVSPSSVSATINGVTATGNMIFRHPTVDVALVQLNRSLPIAGAFPSNPLVSLPASQLIGKTVYCQSWGDNTFAGTGFGTLRSASLQITQFDGTNYRLVTNGSGQAEWFGDSGGSCFLWNGSSWTLTGVQSTATWSPTAPLWADQVPVSAFYDWATQILAPSLGHSALYTNSFQGSPSTPGTNASAWWFAGNAGVDVGAGYSIPGQANDGWANAYSGWNAVNTWLPTTPTAACNVDLWVRTSQSNFGTGYIAANNQANTASLGGTGAFGALAGNPSYAGYAEQGFAFTATDPQEIFYAGFWGNGQDSWMQVDDLTMGCHSKLSYYTLYDWQTGIDIYWTGQGFANGNVQLYYYGIPNAPSGWRAGGRVVASGNRLTAAMDSAFEWSFTECSADQLAGTVAVMAVDSNGNESLLTSMRASAFCANGG